MHNLASCARRPGGRPHYPPPFGILVQCADGKGSESVRMTNEHFHIAAVPQNSDPPITPDKDGISECNPYMGRGTLGCQLAGTDDVEKFHERSLVTGSSLQNEVQGLVVR